MSKRTLVAAGLSGAVALAFVLPGMHVANAQYTTISASVGALPFSFLSGAELGVGSRGTDVAGLQGYLSELGFLTIPAGVAPGYFGTLTQNALIRHQASLGISTSGRFDANTKNTVASSLTSRYPSLSWAWGSSTSSNSQTASNAPSMSPLGQTGYWYNGNWYNSVPTTTDSSIAGYWSNGTWYPVSSAGQVATNSNASGTGYWYNGVWYPTGTANVGGGQSSDTTSGINYSTNLTPTGYWQNGTWYASVPTTAQAANAGIPGYWQNNTWYSLDNSQTTSYGNPNPTNPSSGTGYWQNGVWYSTNPSTTTNTGGYWLNGVWYSTSSSNNTSGPGSSM